MVPPLDYVYATAEARMGLAISLARTNVEKRTGGPFGAAIFDMETHRLLAPGLNLVVSSQSSVAHAEMVAIMTAQRTLGRFDLASLPPRRFELFTSCEPCAMCFGSIPWSGIRRVVCAASERDARQIGFDEGPKPVDWQAELEKRGIEVVRDLCRQEAAAVLESYQQGGGMIYNAALQA